MQSQLSGPLMWTSAPLVPSKRNGSIKRCGRVLRYDAHTSTASFPAFGRLAHSSSDAEAGKDAPSARIVLLPGNNTAPSHRCPRGTRRSRWRLSPLAGRQARLRPTGYPHSVAAENPLARNMERGRGAPCGYERDPWKGRTL
ncbi:hypothetical protein Acsp04_27710 [Actinomadura sp. NBRC 104425]|nr:hypothetical protein Acsp04_27710 [Actinomadura sp. NBRC 104425]